MDDLGRLRTRVVCRHERTRREGWAQRFVVELEDGRQQPYSTDEIEAARAAEATKSGPEGRSNLMRDDVLEVPYLAAGVMVVGRAPGVVVEVGAHWPEAGRSWTTGVPLRRGRTLKMPCRTCGRYARTSEATLGSVLDALYRAVPEPGPDQPRTVTLALIETAIQML